MALYPLSILFYCVPLERAYGLFLAVHFALAIWTAAFLARTVGISRFGALLCGLVYGLSGVMQARAVFPMIIAASVWLPLVLAMVERVIIRYPFRGHPVRGLWVLLGGLGLGVQALAGHPEILIYSLLTVFVYSLWRWLTLPRGQAAPPDCWLKLYLSLAMLIALGLSIGAVQLLPQYLILQDSFRAQSTDFIQIQDWAYPWQQVLTLLVPNYFGNPAQFSYTNIFSGQVVTMGSPISWGVKNFVEGATYVGVLPLVLALFGIRRRPVFPAGPPLTTNPPSPLIFCGLTVMSLSFAFGTPFYYLVYVLPGMEQVHSPFRWIVVSTLGLAVLAGYGIDTLRIHKRKALVAALCCLVGGCLLIIGLLLIRIFFEETGSVLAIIFQYTGGAGSLFSDLAGFFSFEAPWFILLAFFLLASSLVLYVMGRDSIVGQRRKASLARSWQPFVLLVVGVDLILFGWQLYPAAEPDLLKQTPKIVAHMQQDQTLWRFTTFDPQGKKSFPANAGWLYNIQDIRGYDSIFSMDYRRYMETVDQQDELAYNRIAPLRSPTALDSPLLDLLNVKYVLTEEVIDNQRYLLAAQSEELRLYKRAEFLSRAFTLPLSSTILAKDPFAAMLEYDPRFHMIMSAEEDVAADSRFIPDSTPFPARPKTVMVESYTNNEVILSLSAEEPVWLVLTDNFEQGWEATAWPVSQPDQIKELQLLRAYGTFRAVLLEEGDWVVRFSYQPISLVIGLFLSLFAVIIAGGLVVVVCWQARRID